MSRKADIIPADTARTLYGLFLERLRRSPAAPACRQFVAAEDEWQTISWQQLADQVARWQAALVRHQFVPGDRVAIMLRNCWQWVMYDQAALALGLVVVPLYTEDRPENVAYILKDSGSKLLLLANQDSWRTLQPSCTDLTGLDQVISIEAVDQPDADLTDLDHWLPVEPCSLLADELVQSAHDLASIVYTSGTTGAPKGVMLSHWNILFDIAAGLDAITVYPLETCLSFLPLSHTLERSIGYYLMMMAGGTVAYARSIPQLGEDLLVIRPSLLISVPRIYERVYAKIQDQLRYKSPLARRLFKLATEVGWSRFLHQQGRGPWRPSHVLWPLLNQLVAKKVMAKLGGQLRFALCGGAALSPEVAKLFIGLGLKLVQGYGLTETSPVVTVNPLEDNIPAAIGITLKGVETHIGANDELMVRGANVMLGYWNQAQATDDVMTADGWFHTGDKARFEGRHIFITGRLKEIIVLANGEKVPPADMEMAITLDGLFDQAMVYGESRPFLVALVVLNPEVWQETAQAMGMDARNLDSSAGSELERLLLQRLAAALHQFPGYAAVRRVKARLDPWTVDNRLLTPTMKLKRSVVAEHFDAEIQEMYRDH